MQMHLLYDKVPAINVLHSVIVACHKDGIVNGDRAGVNDEGDKDHNLTP